jgi:hypothetical protein
MFVPKVSYSNILLEHQRKTRKTDSSCNLAQEEQSIGDFGLKVFRVDDSFMFPAQPFQSSSSGVVDQQPEIIKSRYRVDSEDCYPVPEQPIEGDEEEEQKQV